MQPFLEAVHGVGTNVVASGSVLSFGDDVCQELCASQLLLVVELPEEPRDQNAILALGHSRKNVTVN